MKRSWGPVLLLWLFCVSAGIITGSSLYERVVVTPLWTGGLPESVRQWDRGVIQETFFAIATPAYGLFSLALAIASRWLHRRQRTWALIAGLSGVVTVVWTFLFFVPILRATQMTAGAGLSDEEIARLVQQFNGWQWGRWTLIIGGWIAGLRALSLSTNS